MTNQASPTTRWYAVHCQPNKEAIAAKNLRNQGYEVFFPKVKKTIRHARKLNTVERPLFPRYLFTQMDIEKDQWRSVNGTFGVVSLVMAGDKPLAAPDGLIDRFQEFADKQQVVDLTKSLNTGGNVLLLSGPFANFVAALERVDGQGRAFLLIEMMGRKVRFVSDESTITPL